MQTILKTIYHKIGIFILRRKLDQVIADRVTNLDCSTSEQKGILKYLNIMKSKGAIFDLETESVILELDGLKLCGPLLDTSFLDVAVENQEDEYLLNFWNLENKTVLDVGANVGDTALKFLSHGAKKVVSLEPNKSLKKYFILNMQKNGFNQYDFFAFGLSAKTETVSAPYRPWASAGTTSLNTLNSRHINKWPEIQLELMSIQSFVDDYLSGVCIDVVKLDCEGSEYGILHSNNLFALNPSLFLIEYHLGPQDLPNLLRKNGYKTVIKEKTKNVGLIYAEKEQ